jgi:putative cardiolipin synthase
VQAASKVFDQYWNSESAYPVAALVPEGKEAPEELRRFRKEVEAKGDVARASPFVQELLDSGWRAASKWVICRATSAARA